MLLSQALQDMKAVVGLVQASHSAIQQRPQLAQAAVASLAALVRNLHLTERQMQADLSNVLQRPLPAPREDGVGAWVPEVERLGLPDREIPGSLAFVAQARRVAADAQNLSQWAARGGQAPQAPRAGPTAGVGEAIASGAAVAVQATPPGKLLGICIMALSTLGTVATAYAGYRAEKKHSRIFGDDDDVLPEDAQTQAQRLLDDEVPGATVRLNRAPEGTWVASVVRGSEVLSREQNKDPAHATSAAAQGAIDRETTRTAVVDDTDIIDITPKKAGGRHR